MKYANNHTWKFKKWRIAYFIGFGQVLMVLSVETINLILLCENDTVMDIIMDFLALVIISDFDEYYVTALKADSKLKLIKDDADRKLAKAFKI